MSNRQNPLFTTAGCCAATLLMLANAAVAQSMKSKNMGGIPRGEGDAGPCVISIGPEPPTPRVYANMATGKVQQAERAPAPSPSPSSRAQIVHKGTVWWVLAPGLGVQPTISYSVRLGLKNTGAVPWTTPVSLTLVDVRSEFDADEHYNDDGSIVGGWPPDTQRTVLAPRIVPMVPLPFASIAAGQTVLNAQATIIESALEWRQRPRYVVEARTAAGELLTSGCPVDDFTAVSNTAGRPKPAVRPGGLHEPTRPVRLRVP